MSLTSSLQRIVTAKANIKSAIEAKGVTVGNDVSIVDYDDYIAQITGGGGGGSFTLEVPLVSSIYLDEMYYLRWTAPSDLSGLGDLSDYSPTLVGYRVVGINVNNHEIDIGVTTNTYMNVVGYGYNTYKVNCVFVFNTNDGGVAQAITNPYSVEKVGNDIGTPFRSGAAATVGDYIYVFGGRSSSGALNTIYRFDTRDNSFTLLNTTLAGVNFATTAVAVGTDIYILGGYGTAYYNTIQKFDTTTETISTITTTLPSARSNVMAIALGTNIYFAGGLNASDTGTLYKFDTVAGTITSVFSNSSYFSGIVFFFVKHSDSDNLFYIVSHNSGQITSSANYTAYVHRFNTSNNSMLSLYGIENEPGNNKNEMQFNVFWNKTIDSQVYTDQRLLYIWGLGQSSTISQYFRCQFIKVSSSSFYKSFNSQYKVIRTTFATHGNNVYVFSGETIYTNQSSFSAAILKISVNS